MSYHGKGHGLLQKVSDYLKAGKVLIHCGCDEPACQQCVVLETFWMKPTLLTMAENLFGLFQAENTVRNGIE